MCSSCCITCRAVGCISRSHTLVLSEEGDLFSFGRGEHGRLGIGSRVTSYVPVQVHISQDMHVRGALCTRSSRLVTRRLALRLSHRCRCCRASWLRR